jgi:hypothetical protein
MFSYKDQQQSRRGDGKQASVAQGLRVTEDEVDAMIDQFATSDETFGKTWSRRVVEGFFMNVSMLCTSGEWEGTKNEGRAEVPLPHIFHFDPL